MSWARLVYLYCDGFDCPRDGAPFTSDVSRWETVADQRCDARREGWVYVSGGTDLCPECRARTETVTVTVDDERV